MHNPTFKSLEEIFSIRREATVTSADETSLETPHEALIALVEEAKAIIAKLERAVASFGGAINGTMPTLPPASAVIDGVFDGKQMIADDGTLYPVPENYASKSKLVEGDLLQRAVIPDGHTYFKQVSRVARATITAA